MKRILMTVTILIGLGAIVMPGTAAGDERGRVRGPHCGGKFVDSSDCSFRYRGGQLYVGAMVRGSGVPSGGAVIRLEAVSSITGHRRVLLSCVTPASGACAAGGSYDVVEHLERGQRLFCLVDGHGRGTYECGTLLSRHRR